MKAKRRAEPTKNRGTAHSMKMTEHNRAQAAMTHTTFAEMLRETRFSKRIKLPHWLFPSRSLRRDQAVLTPIEQQRFLCALDVLIQNGDYGALVQIHSESFHQMHGTQRFLPWHRVYLLELETKLQAIHPDVTIPYWNWTDPQSQQFPVWLQAVTPTIITPAQTIHVVRSPGSTAQLASLAGQIPNVNSNTDFASFTGDLEGVHGGVHVWVGGSMGSIPTAPADPIFWMHHANIDRLWWLWHNGANGQGKNPNLTGPAAIMDPWPTIETDTRDIHVMGFDYV